MSRTIELKTWPEYYAAVASGAKTFEVRLNDRNYQVGDTIILNEYDPQSAVGYTGRAETRVVTYVLDNPEYCKPHYAVLGLKDPGADHRAALTASIPLARLGAICAAEREGRCVVLAEKFPIDARQTSIDVDSVVDIRKPDGDFLLLPCPFCGGTEMIYWQYRSAAGLRWRVACLKCMATIDPGWVQQYGYLADMWNRRVEAEPDAAMKGVENEQPL